MAAKGKRDRAKMAAPPKVEEGDGYEDCIVSFIDILGFKELLKRPASEVMRILKILRHFATPREQTKPRRMKEMRLMSRAFAESVSDAVVRIRVYETQYRDGAFFYEMLDLLHAQIDCVNSGVLIRAGVTVGRAHVGANGEGPVFGEAMARAYRIESDEAVFPRIVIDEAAYQAFLSDVRLQSEDNDFDEERKHVDGLLKVGEDGTRFIDYLRGASKEANDMAEYYTFLDRHAQLIRNGLSTTDGRTRRKYVWLARYHNDVLNELLGRPSKKRAAAFQDAWGFDPIEFLRAAKIS